MGEKFCKTCKWSSPDTSLNGTFDQDRFAICRHPSLIKKGHSISEDPEFVFKVTGVKLPEKEEYERTHCLNMRKHGKCGVDGTLWEGKDETQSS